MNELHVKPNRIFSVGDQLDSDGAAPDYYGIKFAWARYGKEAASHEARDYLRRFKPRQVHVQAEAPPIEHTQPAAVATLKGYSDLLNYMNTGSNWARAGSVLADGLASPRMLQSSLGFDVMPTLPSVNAQALDKGELGRK